MKNKHKFWKKADDGSVKTITVATVIGIVFMLSVGMTIAQQTQGNTVVTTLEKQGYSDPCPCHRNNGGMQTADITVICNALHQGIDRINELGENWYNQQIMNYIIQVIENPIFGAGLLGSGGLGGNGIIQGQQSGGFGVEQISGESIGEQSQGISYDTAPSRIPFIWGFLTWEELQERFDIIEEYCDYGGDFPSWWPSEWYPSADPLAQMLACAIICGIPWLVVIVLLGFLATGYPPALAMILAGVSAAAGTCFLICISA